MSLIGSLPVTPEIIALETAYMNFIAVDTVFSVDFANLLIETTRTIHAQLV